MKINHFLIYCSFITFSSFVHSNNINYVCNGRLNIAPNNDMSDSINLIIEDNFVRVWEARDFTDDYSINKVKDNLIYFSTINKISETIKYAVFDTKNLTISFVYLDKNSTVFYIETFNGKCMKMN